MAWLLALAMAPMTHCFGQYSQTTIATLASGTNAIDKSATALTATTFATAVAAAWNSGSGGVLHLPTAVPNDTTVYHGNYGNARRIVITSSANMQNVAYNPTSFTPITAPNATTTKANQSDYTLTLGLIDTSTEQPPVDEVIKQAGLVVLSRGTGAYPLDIRVTATFSDNSTAMATAKVGRGSGTDDTFFGFIAPEGTGITSLRLQSFVTNSVTPVADRICWDDFAFITGPPLAVPLPVITDVTPPHGAVTLAANGLHFTATTYEAIPTNQISLRVNAVDVSDQLVITGGDGEYQVSYAGLQPDQLYQIEIEVSNSSGATLRPHTLHTYTSPTVLYDADGFDDDNIFPAGPLQNVAHGHGVWEPNPDEPAVIVETGGAAGKVLQRDGTGARRPDSLWFPAVSSGTLTADFDIWVTRADVRTIDIALQAEVGVMWGSFLAWGTITNELAYYNNTSWQPLGDWLAGWHHLRVIHYLSGPAAGHYDVLVDGTPAGTLLPFRNSPVGTAFNRFRIQTSELTPWFEYGQMDNLVLTVGPETAVILPPTIADVSPADRAIAPAADGVQFRVLSLMPLTGPEVELRLNNVLTSLSFSGEATNLIASHAPVAAGNYALDIRATNTAGADQWTSQFIAANEAWMYDPSPGWTGPWSWTSGFPSLETAAPLDGAYLQYDIPGLGVRNSIRQYTARPGLNLSQPHIIRWKFRLVEDDFASNFNSFNDRVHFYARDAARPTGGTDASTSWSISATGNEQTPNSGVFAGQTFYMFDNVDGTGAVKLGNLVNSGIALLPGHVYALAVTVLPASGAYTVAIQDLTTSASFQSAAPHKFRAAAVTATSHTYLHFGVQAAPATEPRALDLDSLEIIPAIQPVTLLDPARTGTTFSFSFVSQAGMQHVVKYTSNLASPNWTTLTTITGDGSLKQVAHPNSPDGPVFYRVVTQ